MTAREYRLIAAKHATLERLYLRLAAKQELHDGLRNYETRMDELSVELVELTREIRELERDATTPPPALEPVPTRSR